VKKQAVEAAEQTKPDNREWFFEEWK